jgi:serine/threonine protein phosphatase PrpC
MGDGMMVMCAHNDSDSIVMEAQKADSFCNQTDSMTAALNLEQWHTKMVDIKDYHAIVLCTDGIADDLQPNTQIPFSQQVSQAYRDLSRKKTDEALDLWLNDWPVPGHTDDKTIVCLYRQKEEQ